MMPQEYHFNVPVPGEKIRALKAGDIVFLSGAFITARDKAHMRMADYLSQNRSLPFDLKSTVIFHGAPIVKKERGEWRMVAIGPTTSARMNDLEPAVIRGGCRIIIGKGGMGKETLEALNETGSVYLSMTGGAAVLGARMIRRIIGMEWEDLGLSEAVWTLEANEFGPLLVTMDSHMNDLYEENRRKVSQNIKSLR
jgi:fumarate hydratase subunit beta